MNIKSMSNGNGPGASFANGNGFTNDSGPSRHNGWELDEKLMPAHWWLRV